jgi:hypothetical protein
MKPVDTECVVLARYFSPDSYTDEQIMLLAIAIQQAVEDHMGDDGL